MKDVLVNRCVKPLCNGRDYKSLTHTQPQHNTPIATNVFASWVFLESVNSFQKNFIFASTSFTVVTIYVDHFKV